MSNVVSFSRPQRPANDSNTPRNGLARFIDYVRRPADIAEGAQPALALRHWCEATTGKHGIQTTVELLEFQLNIAKANPGYRDE